MGKALTLAKRKALVERVRRSRVFKEYAEAFRDTTGLPLALRHIESVSLPFGEDENRNRFCALLSGSREACSACLFQHKAVETAAAKETATLTCFAGLMDSAVPFRLGNEVVGFLVTGQISAKPTDREGLARIGGVLKELSPSVGREDLEAAYLSSRAIPTKKYESILRLLSVFSEYLSSLSNQIMVQEEKGDPPAIARAKQYISERAGSELSLAEVAKSVNLSAYYFCKSFRRATGQTFTEYLARTRVESVKTALANPHKRVSEAAYDAGFQSLSQFNRVFRTIAGESPSAYRERVLSAHL